MNFISLGFWAAFCAFFLIYVFVKKWSRTAMLLWVLAFDLFFFWQANGWLMLLLPATAAVNYYLTEFMRKSGAAAESCGRAAGKTPSPKLILGLIILLDLAALVYFKYSGFFNTLCFKNS